MPTVTIRIPQVLRHHTAGARSVDVEAGAVQEALEALFAAYPTLRESLTPPSGNVLEATNLFLNEQDVATLDGLTSPMNSGDTLTILPAMSGGGQSGTRSWISRRRTTHPALRSTWPGLAPTTS